MIETMTFVYHLLLAAALGIVLGGVFFGGLWWTVHRSVSSAHMAVWIFSSLLLRMGVALGGFYWVALGQHWQRFLACLVGFVLARLIVSWRVRMPADRTRQLPREALHAP